MRWRAIAILLAGVAEMAQMSPMPIGGDQRILDVPYSPDRIVPLHVAVGFALVVELSPDDAIENVVVGNSATWQVAANKRGDHLVIKPLSADAATDMVVTTAERRYVFLLEPGSAGGSDPFVVRFSYSNTPAQPVAAPRVAAQYRLSGNRLLRPATMTDDGAVTRISWPPDSPLPAVFAVERGGEEALVNGRVVDGAYVIQRIAPRFIFRRGKDQAVAVRRPIVSKP